MPCQLIDDGTLDTVVECIMCHERARYNFSGSDWDDGRTFVHGVDEAYEQFVTWALVDFCESHTCEVAIG